MFAIQVRQDATSRVFAMSAGRFPKFMKSRQWLHEWGDATELAITQAEDSEFTYEAS
jgi:hypothetical protein